MNSLQRSVAAGAQRRPEQAWPDPIVNILTMPDSEGKLKHPHVLWHRAAGGCKVAGVGMGDEGLVGAIGWSGCWEGTAGAVLCTEHHLLASGKIAAGIHGSALAGGQDEPCRGGDAALPGLSTLSPSSWVRTRAMHLWPGFLHTGNWRSALVKKKKKNKIKNKVRSGNVVIILWMLFTVNFTLV